MSKKNIILIAAGVVFLALAAFVLFLFIKQTPFRLDEKYYGNSVQTDINADQYNELIKNKASFILFVDQTNCITANGLREMLQKFTTEHPVEILHIMWPETSNTSLRDTVHYFPSVVLVHNGTIVDALQSDSDDYTVYYNSYEDFSRWLTDHIEF